MEKINPIFLRTVIFSTGVIVAAFLKHVLVIIPLNLN